MEVATLPEMEAHHIDPLTGENEFSLSDEPVLLDAIPAGGEAPYKPEPLRNKPKDTELNPDDPSTWGKIGRNEKCPCGSGKKYKQCHGKQN